MSKSSSRLGDKAKAKAMYVSGVPAKDITDKVGPQFYQKTPEEKFRRP